jgi:hypothetical protein
VPQDETAIGDELSSCGHERGIRRGHFIRGPDLPLSPWKV